MRAVFVGNITIDDLGTTLRVGGSGYYGGRALSEYLGVEVYVLSNVSEAYRGLVKSVFDIYGIKLLELQCNDMPVFVIEKGKAVGIKSVGCSIPSNVIESYVRVYRPNILLITPILNEISIDAIKTIPSLSVDVVGMDIQGFVRVLKDHGIELVWRKELESVFPYLNVVHGNIAEFAFSHREQDVVKYIRELSSTMNTIFLVSLDSRGTYLLHRGEAFRIPSLPVNAVDEVGAGDILLSTTTYFLAKGVNALEATIRGVVAASLKVENPYREWFNMELLESYSRELLEHVEEIRL